MACCASRASSSHDGTAGHGSGLKRPVGNGSWRSKATGSATHPWRTTLTSRRRVARRDRDRSGHNPVTSSSVLAGMVSAAAPPTLSRHPVATATASHRRAARAGSRIRVRGHGQPARLVLCKPCSIQAPGHPSRHHWPLVTDRSGSAPGPCRPPPSAPAACRRPGGASRRGLCRARWCPVAAPRSPGDASRSPPWAESSRPC